MADLHARSNAGGSTPQGSDGSSQTGGGASATATGFVVLAQQVYLPFGGVESILNAQDPEETIGFIGERYDSDAGLQYLNARYYDPALGLFLQPDWWDVRVPGVGTNRYSYSFNDPVNLMDPLGNQTVPTGAGFGIIRAATNYIFGSREECQEMRNTARNIFDAVVINTRGLSDGNLTASDGLEVASATPFGRAARWGRSIWHSARNALRSGRTIGEAGNGIYTATRPMTEVFPELEGVNPHYQPGAPVGVNTNCADCVNAAVARLRGNTGAIADDRAGYANLNDLLPSVGYGTRTGYSPERVTTTLLEQGDGSIAVVVLENPGTYVLHSIVAVNRGGAVHFIDPQIGRIVELPRGMDLRAGFVEP